MNKIIINITLVKDTLMPEMNLKQYRKRKKEYKYLKKQEIQGIYSHRNRNKF